MAEASRLRKVNNQVLELYDLNRDFSQTTDLAATRLCIPIRWWGCPRAIRSGCSHLLQRKRRDHGAGGDAHLSDQRVKAGPENCLGFELVILSNVSPVLKLFVMKNSHRLGQVVADNLLKLCPDLRLLI